MDLSPPVVASDNNKRGLGGKTKGSKIMNPPKGKVQQPCKFFPLGKCSKGKACKFQHNEPSGNPKPDPPKQISNARIQKPQQPVVKPERQEKRLDPFPAVRKHKIKEIEEVSYYLPASRSWTQHKVSLISEYHPSDLTTLHTYSTDNEHPLCAAVRSLAEAHCLAEVLREVKRYGSAEKLLNDIPGSFGPWRHPGAGYILDVGGAANRHHSNRRNYVHSCIPNFESKDVMRKFAMKGRYCEHAWFDCSCNNVIASISVHSLYYIENLAQMYRMIVKQAVPVHYAAVHEYKDSSGELMDGEMEYIKRNGRVHVLAKGGIHPYIHSDMAWLAKGQHKIMLGPDRYGWLIWEKDRSFMDVTVYKFTAREGVEVHKPIRDTIEESKELVDAKYTEVAKQSFSAFAPIDAKNYRNYLQRVERKCKAAGLDPARMVKVASTYYSSQEVGLVEMPDQLAINAAKKRRLLEMGALKWDLGKFLRYAVLTITILWIINYTWHQTHDKVDPGLHLATALAGLVLVVGILANMGKFSKLVSWNERTDKHMDMVSLYDAVMHGVKYKLTDYCSTASCNEIDSSKLVKLKEPDDHEEECLQRVVAYPMVFHPRYIPHFPRKCAHNTVKSLTNKLARLIPGAGKYRHGLHPILRQVAKEVNSLVEPENWETWLDHFPGVKRERLRKEKERDANDVYNSDNWNNSGFFIKAEMLPEDKHPRPIVSARVEYNYSSGRYLKIIAELFASILLEETGLYFALHGDADEIGQLATDLSEYCMIDCDFSQFDTSQRKEAIGVFHEFLLECGFPPHVISLMTLDFEACKISTHAGLRAVMKDIGFSGRSETLLRNSFITLNTFLHEATLAKIKGIAVKGDDTVLWFRNEPSVEWLQSLSGALLEQGLVAKLRIVEPDSAEFCSSLFIPVGKFTVDVFAEDGQETSIDYTRMLVPKPGRVLAKTLWCKNIDYTEDEVKNQFVGILKGMENQIRAIPGLCGILKNPVFLDRANSVEAIYYDYQEYSNESTTFSYCETRYFMQNRYDVTPDDIEELEKELQSPEWPIRLNSYAAERMIEVDWSTEEKSADDYLVTVHPEVSQKIVCLATLEELFRWMFPWLTTLIIGVTESLAYDSVFNLVAHLILMLISVKLGLVIALIVHVTYNTLAGPRLDLAKAVAILYSMPKPRQKAVKRKQKVQKQKKKKNTYPSRPMNGTFANVVRMIADPCSATPVHGSYGTEDGMAGKYKAIVSGSSTATSGMILWCPTGNTNIGASPSVTSCFIFVNNNPGATPYNTSVEAWGMNPNPESNNGASLPMGANVFINGTALSDYRTLSACMRMIYTGTVSAAAGRVAYLEGIPATTVLTGAGGNPLSVNNAFSFASKTHRLSLESMEVTWRPNEETSKYFRSDKESVFSRAAGAATVITPGAARFGDTFFGFAWDGIPYNQLQFETYQAIEWRPDANVGYTMPVPRAPGKPIVNRAVEWLDKNAEGWSTNVMQMGSSAVGRAASAALAGVVSDTSRQMLRMRRARALM